MKIFLSQREFWNQVKRERERERERESWRKKELMERSDEWGRMRKKRRVKEG